MMRIFAEQKTRRLFGCLVLAVAVFALPAAAGAALLPRAAAFWVVAAAFVCTGAAVCAGRICTSAHRTAPWNMPPP